MYCTFSFNFSFFSIYFFPSWVMLCGGYFPILPTHMWASPLGPYPASCTLLSFIYESFNILHIPEITNFFSVLNSLSSSFIWYVFNHPANWTHYCSYNLHNYSWLLTSIFSCLLFMSSSEWGVEKGSLAGRRRHLAVWVLHSLLVICSFWEN